MNLLEPYKNIILKIKKDEYTNFKKDDVHPIQKLNFLINSFESLTKTKKGININISDQVVEYNILPLISKQEAIKYGPIASIYSGITKQLVSRLNTIKLTKAINTKCTFVESNSMNVPIYTGTQFKNIIPINFTPDNEWNPLSGVDHKVYKYNELLEKIILSNMKIDNTIYKNFKLKNQQTIISNTTLTKTSDASNICYEELQKFLNKKLTNDDINITREMYLSQFFNVTKVIDSLKHKDYDSIEIIPLSKMLAVFKLI